MEKSILKTENLSIGYGKKSIQKNLNLSISKGTLVSLIGKNGCGKSTLLKTLAGINPLIEGDVLIENQSLDKLNPLERAKNIALVLTECPNISYTKVYDIVKMGQIPFQSWYQKVSKKSLEKINWAIELIKIEDKKERFFNELSDGEKQKVMIAKALAQDTPLIFLDEPTAHLDLPNKIEILILLKNLVKKTGKTIIVATHEINLALQTSDTIWLMKKGEGVEQQTPKDLIKSNSFKTLFSNELYQLDFNTKGFDIKLF